MKRMTTSEKNISNDKLKRVKDFLYTTLNSMTFGIFGTIVVGAIIGTLGTILVYIGLPSEYNVFTRVSGILTALTGAGIGLSIALGLKVSGLKLVMITVAGGIATMLKIDFSLPGFYGDMNLSSPNPITAYFVVIITYFIIESIFKKKTNYDLFFICYICRHCSYFPLCFNRSKEEYVWCDEGSRYFKWLYCRIGCYTNILTCVHWHNFWIYINYYIWNIFSRCHTVCD